MKVYIITKEPFPNGMAAVKRIVCYAKAWTSQNITCEILIYTRTEVYGKKPKNTRGNGIIEGIPFQYMKGSPLRESNVLIRRLNDYMDRQRLRKYLAEKLSVGDVVFAYNGCDFQLVEIINMVHSRGGYYVQELCELPFGTSEETPQKIKMRKVFEHRIFPKVDGVIAISDALVRYARCHCSTDTRIVKIPILVDFPKHEMIDKSDEAKIPYIFHSGTLFQQKDGFLDVLEAFAKVSNRLDFNVNFISTGNPKETRDEKEIVRIIAKYNIKDKVLFTGYLSDEELRGYLSKAAFVVINKLTTKQNQYCFSTKLGEYMAASKAVVTTNVGEAVNWLTNGKDAFIIEPNNVDLLAQTIELAFRNKEIRRKLGNNAHQTCKKYFSIEANSTILRNAVDFRDKH